MIRLVAAANNNPGARSERSVLTKESCALTAQREDLKAKRKVLTDELAQVKGHGKRSLPAI